MKTGHDLGIPSLWKIIFCKFFHIEYKMIELTPKIHYCITQKTYIENKGTSKC